MDKIREKFFDCDFKRFFRVFFRAILITLGFYLLLIVSTIAVLLLSAASFWWPLQLSVFGVDMTPVISYLVDYKWVFIGWEILMLICFWLFYVKIPARRCANKILADMGEEPLEEMWLP